MNAAVVGVHYPRGRQAFRGGMKMRSTVWLAMWIAASGFCVTCLNVEGQRVIGTGSAVPVLATTPECPLINTNATTHQSETEPILVTYDAGTKGELRAAKSVTLHAAAVNMGGSGTVEDFPMARQADGTWLATVTLKGSAVNSGYVMFDVEDQNHNIDRNGGAYWDTQLCWTNRNIPNSRYTMGSSFGSKINSYKGHVMVPGFQRAADPARALEIVRADFAKYPQDYEDLFWIWTFETKNDRGSWEDWEQVSRELDDAVRKSGTDSSMFRQVIGFVAPLQEMLNPGALAKFRAAIIAMPQTVPPAFLDSSGEKTPRPRTKEWDEIMAHEVNFLLSMLDLPPLGRIADPHVRGAAYEAFTKRYGDCGVNCSEVASAYALGLMAYGEANDLDGAQRMGSMWMDWDPKNPDAPATLAQTYLKANARLPQALELVKRAADLQAPIVDDASRQKAQAAIRANNHFTVNPYREEGSIESLRSKIEAALASNPATEQGRQ